MNVIVQFALVWASILGARTGLPDAAHLAALADSAGVPVHVTWAVAHEESRANLNPYLRGRRCWWSARADSIPAGADVDGSEVAVTRRGALYLTHHKRDCEIGRFQIKPSTGARRCPGLDVRTYAGNTRCFVRMFKQDGERYGYRDAIRRHNGAGPKAREYRDRVLAVAHTYYLGEKP